MLEMEIKGKREELGRAIKAAQELGQKVGTDPTQEEAFQKAFKDSTRLTNELRQLEDREELEKQAKEFNKPVGNGPGRDPKEAEPRSAAEKMARMIGAGPLKRLGLPETTEFHALHRESFFMFMLEGQSAAATYLAQHGKVGPKEIHALLGTQGDLGGFLIPEDFRREIVKDLAGFAVMRNVARVIPTSSSTLVLPSIQSRSLGERNYPSGYTGAWKPEGYVTGGTAPPVQTQPLFSQERIPVHVWQPDAIEISTELLADSAVPLDSVLAEIIAETRAMDEDSAFLVGDGIGKPLGLLDAGSNLITINSGSSANVTYDGLVDTFTGLPAQYRQNARWLMNSTSFGQILKLKDSVNRPILLPNEIPGNLWTKPMLFSEFMPTPAASSKSVVFGDFRYYVIAERTELRIQRLTERFAPNVGILPTARVGGQVIRRNAFRVLSLAV